MVWQGVTPPESWQKSLVIPLHKKEDLMKCKNYRGISLLNSGHKIYANIIKNKLYDYYKDKLGEEQNGFKEVDDHAVTVFFSLKILIEKHREFNVETHLAFIDLEKAFDKVNRNKLLDILIADDIPDQIISAIYNKYNNKISVKLRPDSSEWRPINEGV
jgi:sorting nexin-29